MTRRNYVVDTNLLISASFGMGAPLRGIEKIVSTQGLLLFSQQTFEEFERVLMRPKFDRYLSISEREETLAAFINIAIFVEPIKHFTHCRDAKDNQFLDVAFEGRVEALITGDQDLLVLENIEGIPIICMSDYLG